MVFIKQNLIKIKENKNQYKTDDISKKENINITPINPYETIIVAIDECVSFPVITKNLPNI